MQERAFEKRGEQYLLIKSPPASGKSRALMFIALDKLQNQGVKQAIIVVPERSIGAQLRRRAAVEVRFLGDWEVKPQWNLCNAPGGDEPRRDQGQGGRGVSRKYRQRVLVCTHATFRFAVDELGVEAFDNRLIAIDEFHHVWRIRTTSSALSSGRFIVRDKVHIVAMTGSYFRGDAVPCCLPRTKPSSRRSPTPITSSSTATSISSHSTLAIISIRARIVDAIVKVLDPAEKTIVHIPNVNARESTKDKMRRSNDIMDALGDWQGDRPGYRLSSRQGARGPHAANGRLGG